LAVDRIAFGRALYRTLPQDRYDKQPLLIGSGRFLLAADVRLDNRQELLQPLGLPTSALGALSDAELLAKAFEKWPNDLLDRLVGDFAFAIFDRAENRLQLARDPLGQRPLHFRFHRDFVAFASMPHGLAALPQIDLRIDPQRIAEFAAGMNLIGPGSFYEQIERVEPGESVTLTPERFVRRKYWNPRIRDLRLWKTSDYVEAMREQLDRATASRLRGAEDQVAAHLSGGCDSSAVAATAARLLAPQGGKVVAFTSAPRGGFDGPVPRGRVADETPYAAMTAALYPNMEHVVLRDDGRSALSHLTYNHRHYQYPIQQVDNDLWWSRTNQVARERGIRVLLTGQYGNLTLNASGLGLLADLVRTGAWSRWWNEARLAVRNSPARWTGVLANSLGPWLPPRLFDYIRALALRSSTKANTPHILAPAWAGKIDNRVRPGRDGRPQRDSYAVRLELLKLIDLGCYRKGSLAGYGIDERDPTADRRLIEFCLSLPHNQLLKNGITRPLARAALADRLPRLIANGAPRGLQGAGWYEILHRDEVADHIESMGPIAQSILNVPRLRDLVDRWPTGNWNDDWVVQDYRQSVATAVSIADFIRSVAGDPATEAV
jgi:asparagine synthase (glutamine-hydrolysing)